MNKISEWAEQWEERRKTMEGFPSQPVILNLWLDNLADAILADAQLTPQPQQPKGRIEDVA